MSLLHDFKKLEQESLIFALFTTPERTNLVGNYGNASR
jgi:hypothetical protein